MKRWLLFRSLLVTATSLTLPAPAPAASPRAPEDYPQIRRELRIGADVLRAALDDAVPESRRVVDVETGYLAGQGVLVIVDLVSPWLRIDGRSIDIAPEITGLERIPDMVHEILTELNLGLPRHQVEDLEELREIRDAQRAVRAERRALRSELREKRRRLQRTGDAAAAEGLRREIEHLEADLAAAEDEERALDQDAASVRDTLDPPAEAARDAVAAPVDVDMAVAESICSYGATFKFLTPRQHLNVLVRQSKLSRYYVFEMERVRACRDGDITPDSLLDGSFGYEA